MRSSPSDFFIDQTRAVCAEPLTSGVAISESCLKTAAANAVAGFTCFRNLQADLQRARIDVKWSSPMPTGLSRLLPRISNLLAQSMLSPVQEVIYQHSMSTKNIASVSSSRPSVRSIWPIHNSQKEIQPAAFQLSVSDHRIIDNLSRYAIAFLIAIHTSRAVVMPVPLQS